jgi:hypothetical protein
MFLFRLPNTNMIPLRRQVHVNADPFHIFPPKGIDFYRCNSDASLQHLLSRIFAFIVAHPELNNGFLHFALFNHIAQFYGIGEDGPWVVTIGPDSDRASVGIAVILRCVEWWIASRAELLCILDCSPNTWSSVFQHTRKSLTLIQGIRTISPGPTCPSQWLEAMTYVGELSMVQDQALATQLSPAAMDLLTNTDLYTLWFTATGLTG